MATVVEFSNATIADALKRANIVAPTRGRELDMFKGFVFDVFPDEEYVILRTTNGELYYTEYLYPVSIEADKPTTWRVASMSTFGVVSNLPVKGTCKFKDEGGKLRITSSRTKATTPLIRGGDYPDVDQFMFEPEGMVKLEGYGTRLDLVGWAASTDGMPPRCGVYMDGDHLCATNGTVLARVPNEYVFADGRDNVVMPYALIAPIIRTMEEVEVGVIGNHMVFSPTEDIFIKCTLFEPRFDAVNRVMEKEFPNQLSFSKDDVVGALSRVSKIGSADRQIALDVYLVGDTMTLSIKDKDSAEEIEESILLISESDHEGFVRYIFGIEHFTNAVTKSSGKNVIMHYNAEKPTSVVKFEGEGGYESAIMPRIDVEQMRRANES